MAGLKDLSGFDILFVVANSASPNSGETAFHDALETAGATCDLLSDEDLDSSSDSGYDMVIISASVGSSTVAGDTTAYTIPVMSAEAFAWDDDSLADTPAFSTGNDTITITDDTHPIIVDSGQSNGALTIIDFPSGINTYHATDLGSGADIMATISSEPCLFVYEPGADLVSGTAAGLRICCFSPDGWYTNLNSDGQSVIEGCVNYALGLLGSDIDATLGVLDVSPTSGTAAVLEANPSLGVLDVSPTSGTAAVLEANPSLGVLDVSPVSDDAILTSDITATLDPLDVSPTTGTAAILEANPSLGVLDVSPVSDGASMIFSVILDPLDVSPTSTGASLDDLGGAGNFNEFIAPRSGRRYAAVGLSRR